MYPFSRSFDPSRKHKYCRVPATFGSPAKYLEVQETNCKAELSACVRDNQRLARRTGTVVSRGGDARAGGETCTVEITNADNEDSLSKHLLRSPQQSFHIVSRSVWTPPDEHDPNGRHLVVVLHLPLQFEVGQAITFDDFGFVGDAVRQMEAIRELRQRGPAVPLLRVVADPRVQLRGKYRAVTAVGNPWGANEKQLSTLHDREDAALKMIQGPPGCGKTKLIADILAERIPSDATALATSTSRQAIDNLCEKVESVAPGVLPVVLGNRTRFLDPDSLKKNKKHMHKPKPPVIVYRWLYKFHLETQVERDPEVVAAQTELDRLKLEQDTIPRRLAEEAAEEYYPRASLAQAQKRSAIAQLGPLSPDVLGVVCSQEKLQNCTPTYFQRLAMRIGRALERLEEACLRAKSQILDACRVFVCTVGSVHYATEYSASKNLTTIVVDESSRLCEMDVPRLLVVSPALQNLVLVGDQRQLEPFTNSMSPAAKSSLMQRFEVAAATFHMLTEQYRMDPSICHLISQFAYAGKLRTNADAARLRKAERIPGRSPLQFHSCGSGEEQHSGSRSFRNLAEVDRVEQLYVQERQLDWSATITVITFYADQVAEIANRLRRYNDPRLTVCTVDKAQGSEADVVILSCVRTTKITMFGQDKKRMTVALSRAKNRLHVVGCREALETSENWRWVLRMTQI